MSANVTGGLTKATAAKKNKKYFKILSQCLFFLMSQSRLSQLIMHFNREEFASIVGHHRETTEKYFVLTESETTTNRAVE